MKRSVVLSWLQAHGGQKKQEVDYIDVPNPKYAEASSTGPGGTLLPGATAQPRTIKRRVVIWTSNDGQQLRVFDDTPNEKGNEAIDSGESSPGPYANTVSGLREDPDYEFIDSGEAKRDTNEPLQTPYQQALSANDLKEAQANQEATGRFETNAQRDARLATEEAQQRARRDQQIQEGNVTRQQEIDARAAEQQKEANRLAQERLDAEKEQQAGGLEVSRGNLTLAQQREQREAATANQPHFLSNADPSNPNIAAFNPATGLIETTPNPNYDAVKAEGQRLMQELTIGIQLGNLDQNQAKQKYDQWFQQNVTVPFMAAQESRAQAADQRAAQQAEEQRRQFGADFGLRSAEFGETAGQHAAQNEIALLPYRVGDKFGPDMSSAINSLAAGGDINGPSPSAGIHFGPGDFTYQAPNLQKIAQKATAAALAHLTSYKPGDEPFATAAPVALPNASTFAGAPASTPIVDPAQLGQQYQQLIGAYKPPAQAAP
jgi:hypothetical protein